MKRHIKSFNISKYFNALLIFILTASNIHLNGQKVESAIKTFSSCVAFLNDTKVETTKIDGKVFEIWLKEQGKNFAVPKNYRITGSAFFVVDTFSQYLVTAEHVAKGMTLNSDIVINGLSDKPTVYKIKDMAFRKDSLKWTFHKEADVATLLLDLSSNIFQNPHFNFIPSAIIEMDRIPLREREVTIIGFPFALGYDNFFSPISKLSKPSSGLIELPRSDNNKVTTFFLLDDPSISGFSGSPVIELPTHLTIGENSIFVKAYRLMGLVHGSLNDKNGGGFAAIVPSKYILETIKESPKYSGIERYYYENGKLWSERYIVNGKIWSVKNNFDKSGNPLEMGTLKDGSGSLFLYDIDSKLIKIEYYENGVLSRTENK